MDMTPLTSSNLAAAGYDPESRVLRIQFHNGRTYEYDNVPQHEYDGLISAGSAGQYFNSNIKGQYSERMA